MREQNTVPNLQASASDGNAKFTPRQWLELFWQLTKREHKINMAPLTKKKKSPNGPEKNS